MQDQDKRYGGILDIRAREAFISLQKLTQTRTCLLVPGFLGRSDVRDECAPFAAHDVIQAPGPHTVFGSNRQWQPGAHTTYHPISLLHIRGPERADQSTRPFLLPPKDVRQTLQRDLKYPSLTIYFLPTPLVRTLPRSAGRRSRTDSPTVLSSVRGVPFPCAFSGSTADPQLRPPAANCRRTAPPRRLPCRQRAPARPRCRPRSQAWRWPMPPAPPVRATPHATVARLEWQRQGSRVSAHPRKAEDSTGGGSLSH